MNDDQRNVAAARRAARRLARRTGHPYQTCLDLVARDCGRLHWGDYMERPVAIPRETERHEMALGESREAMIVAIGRPLEMREVWTLTGGDRPEGFRDDMFAPAFNALASSLVPTDARKRRAYLETIAEVLVPKRGGKGKDDYFDQKGRATLFGFLLLIVEECAYLARRGDAGVIPSIPYLVRRVNDGLRKASDMATSDRERLAAHGLTGHALESEIRFMPDRLSQWLANEVLVARDRGYDEDASIELLPLVSMSPAERSGILGTMDKGLLPFKNPDVARRTS